LIIYWESSKSKLLRTLNAELNNICINILVNSSTNVLKLSEIKDVVLIKIFCKGFIYSEAFMRSKKESNLRTSRVIMNTRGIK